MYVCVFVCVYLVKGVVYQVVLGSASALGSLIGGALENKTGEHNNTE